MEVRLKIHDYSVQPIRLVPDQGVGLLGSLDLLLGNHCGLCPSLVDVLPELLGLLVRGNHPEKLARFRNHCRIELAVVV